MELEKLGAIRFRKAYEKANIKNINIFTWLEIAEAIEAVEITGDKQRWQDWKEAEIVQKIEELDKYMN